MSIENINFKPKLITLDLHITSLSLHIPKGQSSLIVNVNLAIISAPNSVTTVMFKLMGSLLTWLIECT